MRLCEGLENTTNSLLTKLDISAAAWKLGGANDVTEARSFYLHLDDGSTLIFQIAFTNVAWPSDWFQVNAHYLASGQRSVEDKGRIEHCDNVNRFWAKISKDKLSVEASSGSIRIKSTQEIRIKLKCGKLAFDLVLGDQIGLVTLGDGCIHIPEEGHIHTSFFPCLRGEGSFRVRDEQMRKVTVRGMGILQWHGVKLHRCASQLALGWYESETFQIITMQIQGSTRQDYECLSLNIMVKGEKIVLACLECHLETEELAIDRKVGMRLLGKDLDGNEVILEAKVDELTQLTRIKVMEKVPFLVRKVIQAFMPNPVISHYKSSSARLVSNGKVLTEGIFLLEESIIHKQE